MTTSALGNSLETAIVILATSPEDGVAQEYQYLSSHYGKKDIDWRILYQALIEHEDRRFDKLGIQLTHQAAEIFFDISSFTSSQPRRSVVVRISIEDEVPTAQIRSRR